MDLSSDTDAITLFRCGLYFTAHTYISIKNIISVSVLKSYKINIEHIFRLKIILNLENIPDLYVHQMYEDTVFVLIPRS